MDDGALSPTIAGNGLNAAEVAERLGIVPHVLRGLLDEFADLLPGEERNGERVFPPLVVERLRSIWQLRSQGLAPEAIRARLAAPEGEPLERLLAQLSELRAELQHSEARRVEDRDRLMMALMRTQQEIQRLRYELTAASSRRERRRGFWARLLG